MAAPRSEDGGWRERRGRMERKKRKIEHVATPSNRKYPLFLHLAPRSGRRGGGREGGRRHGGRWGGGLTFVRHASGEESASRHRPPLVAVRLSLPGAGSAPPRLGAVRARCAEDRGGREIV
ncbi:Os10g0482133 [Oryza sativa Japonica Group]|uniref:Os10g0482133 protein n=3 Tax=Oryza TaxID=4527 RepID=Q8LNW9_ORYSJ|nr:hypothetical protein [Oryza sativa Japonica Group]BAT11350.1 Os10g0482133 [Oryza sativa Japonica Group]